MYLCPVCISQYVLFAIENQDRHYLRISSYFVSNLRMVLDVVVCPGKQHSATPARPGLSDVLDRLNKNQLPVLECGDYGCDIEPFIDQLDYDRQGYPSR